jgi:hypothetical protein
MRGDGLAQYREQGILLLCLVLMPAFFKSNTKGQDSDQINYVAV